MRCAARAARSAWPASRERPRSRRSPLPASPRRSPSPRLAGGELLEDRLADLPDIPRAEREQHVARLELGEDGVGHLPLVLEEDDLPPRLLAHGALDEGGSDAWDRGLPRRVDLGEEEEVRTPERIAERAEEITGARVAVRLEEDDDTPRPRLPEPLEGRPDLGRMVAVVVDHCDPRGLALHLEAPADPREHVDARRDLRERDADLEPDADRGEGVPDVVHARDPELDLAQRHIADDHREPRAVAA